MKNKKLEKLLVKSLYGGAITFLLGLTYKIGQRIESDLDEKYEKEHGVPKHLFGNN